MSLRVVLMVECDVCKKPIQVTCGIRTDYFNFKADFRSVALVDGKDPLVGWRTPHTGDPYDAPVLCPEHAGLRVK